MSDSFDYDIVCIGSGPAGQRAAVQAAKLGRRVALIERRGTLGGMCVDSGTIPSKTFREAVMWLAASSAAASAASTTHTPQRRPTSAELLRASTRFGRAKRRSFQSSSLERRGRLCGEHRSSIRIAFASPLTAGARHLVCDDPHRDGTGGAAGRDRTRR
jgi:choline dehydrogenase-like flavoprotein